MDDQISRAICTYVKLTPALVGKRTLRVNKPEPKLAESVTAPIAGMEERPLLVSPNEPSRVAFSQVGEESLCGLAYGLAVT